MLLDQPWVEVAQCSQWLHFYYKKIRLTITWNLRHNSIDTHLSDIRIPPKKRGAFPCASAVLLDESHITLARRSRKLLLTTNTLLKAMAAAASIGTKKPSAAAGIRITL